MIDRNLPMKRRQKISDQQTMAQRSKVVSKERKKNTGLGDLLQSVLALTAAQQAAAEPQVGGGGVRMSGLLFVARLIDRNPVIERRFINT